MLQLISLPVLPKTITFQTSYRLQHIDHILLKRWSVFLVHNLYHNIPYPKTVGILYLAHEFSYSLRNRSCFINRNLIQVDQVVFIYGNDIHRSELVQTLVFTLTKHKMKYFTKQKIHF